jgi:hypothetical protein
MIICIYIYSYISKSRPLTPYFHGELPEAMGAGRDRGSAFGQRGLPQHPGLGIPTWRVVPKKPPLMVDYLGLYNHIPFGKLT